MPTFLVFFHPPQCFISSPGKSDIRLAGQQLKLSPRTDSRSTSQVHVAGRRPNFQNPILVKGKENDLERTQA